MDNLAFHITDLTANSIRAGATEIHLAVTLHPPVIDICIDDNGCGMDAATVARATSPFYTTRTTRRVGLGLPFLIQNAEQTGGGVSIVSEPGRGTRLRARFVSSHIDCPPMGDLPATVAMLIAGNPELNLHFAYHAAGVSYTLSTRELQEALDGIPISHPKVFLLIEQLIGENIG